MLLTESTVSPLTETLERVSALDAYLAADSGPLEPGWFRATALAHSDSPLLAEGLSRQAARYPGIERRTCGSFFIGDYAWYVPAAAIAAYLAERRVPDLSAQNVALRYSTYTWEEDGESGESERVDVRFLSSRFAALPDDPAANDPATVVVADDAALREWLREQLEAHLAPLIHALYAQTRLGTRAQWNLVADACAALFLHAGKHLGNPTVAQTEGLAFVKAPGSPLRNRDTGYITLECAGHCETFRARGGCCRYYTLPDGEKCSTCVLRPAEERVQRLRTYMEQKWSSAAAE